MEILREWYLILSRLSATLAGPLGELSTRLELPLASPFLFGLIGAVAPCQLTTNASAMAYPSPRPPPAPRPPPPPGPRGGGAPLPPPPPPPARAPPPRGGRGGRRWEGSR